MPANRELAYLMGEDSEHNGVGFVEISIIFAMQDDYFVETVPFDELTNDKNMNNGRHCEVWVHVSRVATLPRRVPSHTPLTLIISTGNSLTHVCRLR